MALSNVQEIIEVANKLGECADKIHERTLKFFNEGDINEEKASILFQDETLLRTQINKMYIEAANLVVEDVQETQIELLSVIDEAKEKINRVSEIVNYMGLASNIVAFASAIYAKKTGSIVSSFREIRSSLKDINN